jgi:hypothetical protein
VDLPAAKIEMSYTDSINNLKDNKITINANSFNTIIPVVAYLLSPLILKNKTATSWMYSGDIHVHRELRERFCAE